MELGELIRQLERVVKEMPDGQGARRDVFLRAQNDDEFVWTETELRGVEAHTDAPAVVLVGLVTPEQENMIMSSDPDDAESPEEEAARRAAFGREGACPSPIEVLIDSAVEPVGPAVRWPAESNPTPAQLASPEFEAVWQVIRTWDINVPGYDGKGMYSGAMGNHVVQILKALVPALIASETQETVERWE